MICIRRSVESCARIGKPIRELDLLLIQFAAALPILFSDERWKFLGIEESHCYDEYMSSDLKQAAF